jgi:hypothetical protein
MLYSLSLFKCRLNNHVDAKEQFLILNNLPSYILSVLLCGSDHTKASKTVTCLCQKYQTLPCKIEVSHSTFDEDSDKLGSKWLLTFWRNAMSPSLGPSSPRRILECLNLKTGTVLL